MKKVNFNLNIAKHINDSFWFYILSIIAISTGIVLGIYIVKYMGNSNSDTVAKYFESLTYNFKNESFNGTEIFKETLKSNVPYVIFIWLLGITAVGIPFILILDFIKGFTLGFSASFITLGLGTKGIWINLLAILPQNIFFIPCILVGSSIAMKFSAEKLKNKLNRRFIENYWIKFYNYSIGYVFILFVMIIGFLYQSYISPSLIKVLIARS
ncbi:MAG: stage II sporulation protein M [Bacillota bacterium]|nr:stage II sporulation protein M [Bacillota bacterium]